jgi:predicted MFS family arabinose efflux permease
VPVGRSAFRRDAVTWLVHGQLAVWGWFLFGFAPVVPLLRDEFDVSRAVAGLHGSLAAAGSVCAGFAYPRLTARLGRGPTSWLGTAGLCVGVGVLGAGHRLPFTLLGALIAGTFGSLLVTGSSAILSDHHGVAGPAAITETNAVAAGTGLLGPAAVGGCVALGWGWRPAVVVLLIPAGILALALHRTAVPDTAPDVHHDRNDRLPRAYWIAWTVVVAIIGVEFSMTLWSSDLLRSRAGLADGAAAASVSAVVGGMFVGRLLGTGLTARHHPDRMLLAALGLSAIGFTLFWCSTAVAPAIAGLALTGTGMSLHYPLAVARLIAASEGRPDRAVGRMAMGAGIAGMVAPVGLGATADAIGTHRAFLGVPVLIGLAALAVLRAPTPVPAQSSGLPG